MFLFVVGSMGKDIVFGEDWFVIFFVIYGFGVVILIWVIIFFLVILDFWDILIG